MKLSRGSHNNGTAITSPAQTGTPPGIGSSIDMDYIQNLAMTQGEDGAKAVENYHQAMFLHEHGLELERFKQEEHIHKDRLLHLEQQLEGTRNRLSEVERLEPIENDGELDDQPTTPWNIWDRVMFALGALGILSMVVFGIMNISFNLLESGIVTFMEHPIRAYFWAALLPVGALAVKVGWDLLENDRSRANYVWATLGIGILSLLVWIGAYALVYPSLSKTTEEQIGSLTVFDSGATPGSDTTVTGVKTLDMINVIAQAISEICLSAVLGIYLTMIYQRHRPVHLAINPTFFQFDQERASLEKSTAIERMSLATAQGQLNHLENKLKVITAYAKALFEKEAIRREENDHQKHLTLSRIENELRSHLHELDNPTSNNGTSTDIESTTQLNPPTR